MRSEARSRRSAARSTEAAAVKRKERMGSVAATARPGAAVVVAMARFAAG